MCAEVVSDTVPENPLANYLAIDKIKATTNAGAGVGYTQHDTNMAIPAMIQAQAPNLMMAAWELHYFIVYPFSAGADPNPGSGVYVFWQVSVGQQTAVLDADDNKTICQGLFGNHLATSGATAYSFPMALSIVRPFPFFAEDITFLTYTPNVAQVNSKDWIGEAGWAPIQINVATAWAILRATGQV